MAVAPPVWIGDSLETHLEEWPGNEDLAATMKEFKVKAPPSRIMGTEMMLTALNRERLGKDVMKRIVELDCGHLAITKNTKTVHCGACQDMIDRGADFDLYRKEMGLEE